MHPERSCQCALNPGHVCCVQLGDGTNTDRNTPSADVLTSVAAIVAGWYHTCALTASGGVRCWGSNLYGQASAVHARGVFMPVHVQFNSGHVCCVQLGDGTTAARDTPSVDVLTSVAAITAGESHTCALTASGGVRCWGRGDLGQASAVHALVGM
jgi:alpha-tubulin suppressor-like RCC1 family protein